MSYPLRGLRTIQIWAPSNIAWIKYMGKSDASRNLPANPSLSMTLDGLGTSTSFWRGASGAAFLVWEADSAREGIWIPEWDATSWSKLEQQLDRVWEQGAQIAERFELPWSSVRLPLQFSSYNTFPTASGIASSASGMAAFTLGAFRMFCGIEDSAWMERWDSSPELRLALSALSRQGSGSSCRSFEGPWIQWDAEEAKPSHPMHGNWVHRVVIVDSQPKRVSSSEAHRRVPTSPLWSGRADRAHARLERVQEAMRMGDRVMVATEVWQEFWEMHSLFHTSSPPFTYWNPKTLEVLKWVEPRMGDGMCIATMDAGPNVHFTIPEGSAALWDIEFAQAFPALTVMKDRPGHGVRWKGELA